jgi:hypothetical protein
MYYYYYYYYYYLTEFKIVLTNTTLKHHLSQDHQSKT